MAIVDLMARHFARGEFSLYYWGQQYYGVLDPILLIPLFKIFGFSPLTSQILPYIFSVTFLLLYFRCLSKIYNFHVAVIATLILAIGSPYFLHVTFETYSYIITLNFGLLFWLVVLRMRRQKLSGGSAFLLGLWMGFCWYYFRLIGLFWAAAFLSWIIPMMTSGYIQQIKQHFESLTFKKIWTHWFLLERRHLNPRIKKWLVLINIGNGINALVAMVLWCHGDWVGQVKGHTVKLYFSPICESSVQLAMVTLVAAYWEEILKFLRAISRHVTTPMWISGFLIGFSPAIIGSIAGHLPASNATFVSMPVILKNARIVFGEILPFMFMSGDSWLLKSVTAFISLAGAMQLVSEAYSNKRKDAYLFSLLLIVNFVVVLFLMRIGDQWNSRYLIPFYICIPPGIALFFLKSARRARHISWVVLGLFLFANGRLALLAIQKSPEGALYLNTARSLIKQGYKSGYADLWLAYHITALADEKVILAPIGEDDRYKPYLDYVRDQKQVVVLGEKPLQVGSLKLIKGVYYRVLELGDASGISLMLMEKII